MKLMIIYLLGAAVFATPCIYDVTSLEPSALAGLLVAVSSF
ncbi:hypothetical protein [Neorhizobium galegae]|uniref:Uncharacterized protein n=1 Tax=Neorhizobium galegae bv. orientalis str. HAMBI 540 TaxID=1028800 RepID=A0A068SYU0_NEOGA|nr:hypothetical protein [Neorhizobium galegae]CDN51029.1 Hypothetical protein RG540_PA03510 [Neorhizobium galegae bv. orientalis str. HAMBI 540]CDZ44059.1 Hypothetical protein NGAL_HAMBI2427_05360 [Neorhizobium galegae bv. orientalis]